MSVENSEINLSIESVEIKSNSNKTNIGEIIKNWLVCSECGKLTDSPNSDCQNHNSSTMTLKVYYEKKFNKPYVPEDWKWESLPDLRHGE